MAAAACSVSTLLLHNLSPCLRGIDVLEEKRGVGGSGACLTLSEGWEKDAFGLSRSVGGDEEEKVGILSCYLGRTGLRGFVALFQLFDKNAFLQICIYSYKRFFVLKK